MIRSVAISPIAAGLDIERKKKKMTKKEIKNACKNCLNKARNNNICPMPDKCAVKNIDKEMEKVSMMLKSFNKYFGS